MFDLKRPCVNCPFRKGHGNLFGMDIARLLEIKHAVAFQCHKTVDYSNFRNRKKRSGDHPQQCAGLMAILAREDEPNQIMQVAMRFGVLDLSTLDPCGEAYDSWRAAVAAHGGDR